MDCRDRAARSRLRPVGRYKGNEEWTTALAADGVINEKGSWHPWFDNSKKGSYAPAGYVTSYDVPDKQYAATRGDDFAFLTIRLAGHMVPTFQPEAALNFFARFIAGDTF